MKKIIAGIIILFFAALITVTIIYVIKSNDVDYKINEVREIATVAIKANREFTPKESEQINEIINYLKEMDNGTWGFIVKDDIQKYPEFAEHTDLYLMTEMELKRGD